MRLTFLSHFIISLAIAAGAWFAWRAGVFSIVWANDQSHVTSLIAALFVVTVIELGRQAWLLEGWHYEDRLNGRRYRVENPSSSGWGHQAKEWSVMMGLLGTTIGLSLQATALAQNGTASLGALSTSLFSTGTGVVSALLIGVMTYSLEMGIKRSTK